MATTKIHNLPRCHILGLLSVYESWSTYYFMHRCLVSSGFENNNEVHIDDYGFLQVDLIRVTNKIEHFIITSQARQIFDITDHVCKKCYIILITNKFNGQNKQEYNNINIEDDHFIHISFDIDSTINDILYMRNDHNERIWISPTFCVSIRK